MHDLLFNKRGVSAPSDHPLRLAVEKHRARLAAELTRARLKRGFATLEQLHAYVEKEDERGECTALKSENRKSHDQESVHKRCVQPRWVRVNTLKTTVQEQLKTTFADYQIVESLDEVLSKNSSPNTLRLVHFDKHIPNLLALPSAIELTTTRAYLDGMIILQDKASCFPAYTLNLDAGEECLDACAAPGNKTTHLAAILHEKSHAASRPNPTVFAIERDARRVLVLESMIRKAGASAHVCPYSKDFLKLDPQKPPCSQVSAVLLDPSCSGSGIVSRDETLNVTLPRMESELSSNVNPRKKRKRPKPVQIAAVTTVTSPEESLATNDDTAESLQERLTALSSFQLRLLLHAFHFPKAHKITYSTCSVYPEENENVVVTALLQSRTKGLGWRMLARSEQIEGMQAWNIRGDLDACQKLLSSSPLDAREISEACIRCEKGTKEGTQGFFVAAFTRDPPPDNLSVKRQEEEWEGFSDT